MRDSNPVKKFQSHSLDLIMAVSPVDKNSSLMQEEFGTVVLITDPAADRYLAKAAKQKQCTIPEDRYSRPCGGRGGFDDFVERWHQAGKSH